MPLTPCHKKYLKIISLTLGGLLGVVILILASLPLILSQNNLTRWVNEYSNRYLNANVKIDTVALSLISGFPYAEIKLSNGLILSKAFENEPDSLKKLLPERADSLLQFGELSVSLSIPDILLSKVNIKRISITHPRAFAYIAPWGKANWDIYESPDSTAEETDDELDLSININRFSILQGGDFVYDSRPDNLKAAIGLNRIRLRGNLSTEKEKFELNRGAVSKLSAQVEHQKNTGSLTLDTLGIVYRKKGFLRIDALAHIGAKADTLLLCNNLPLEINGSIRPDTLSRGGLYLDRLKLSAAEFPLLLDGHILLHPDSIYTDLTARIESCKIASLLQYIPKQLYPAADSLSTNTEFTLDAKLKGFYSGKTRTLPSFDIHLTVPDSYVEFTGKKSRINQLEADIRVFNSAARKDSLGISIGKFILNGRGMNFNAQASVTNLLGDPYIDGTLCTIIHLDTLSALFPSKTGICLSGDIDIDIAAKSLLSNLNVYKIGNADLKGQIAADMLKINVPPQDIALIMEKGKIRFGAASNTADTTIEQGMKMLALVAELDSAFFRYKDQLLVKGSGLRFAGHNAADILSGDTTRVHPFNGQMDVGGLEMKAGDSTRILLRRAQTHFSVLPYRNNYKIPLLKLSTQARLLALRDQENRYSLMNGNFTIQAVMNGLNRDSLRQLALGRYLDSLQTVYPRIPRDSLLAYRRSLYTRNRNRQKDDFANQDIDLKVDTSLAAVIRNWDISGYGTAATGRVTTPYFPLRTRMQDVDFSFTTDGFKLNDTKVISGQSRLSLSGQIAGLKRAMMGRGKLRLDLDIESDTLNFNELMRAANRGKAYLQTSESFKDSLRTEEDEDKLNEMIVLEDSDTLQNMDLIIIPSNIDAKVNMDVKYGRYAHLTLDRVSGELIAKDRCLQLNNFKALTDAGEIYLDAFYSTRNKHDLSTGFDLELRNIEAAKLVSLIPGTDSLLPMLRSLEGNLNCQLAATSRIDTLMNIQLPTLRGVARIKGDSLVLLDGETFTEIAKKMHFKNKKRNLIDKMSVEILIKDNTIEIFPFLIEMDRYRAAVSGTQSLDMNFNYHISVLHSPIPIRLGVDVYGNLDDFHFRIGRAKYKNTDLPVYAGVIDSTRLNLRNYITHVFQRGVEAALRNGGSLDAVERFKRKHQDIGEMETLSEEELRQLNQLDSTGQNTVKAPLQPTE